MEYFNFVEFGKGFTLMFFLVGSFAVIGIAISSVLNLIKR